MYLTRGQSATENEFSDPLLRHNQRLWLTFDGNFLSDRSLDL